MQNTFIVFFLFLSKIMFSQEQFTLKASYQVQIQEDFTLQTTGKIIDPLDFEGVYMVKGQRVISYLKPLYVGKYPKNEIVEEVGTNKTRGFSLNTDSIIAIDYSAGDSMIMRCTDYTTMPNMQKPYSFHYEPGFRKWDIQSETKDIDGFLCQRAINRYPNGDIQFDVWFCPSVPVPRGFYKTYDIPGLVVEGQFSTNTSFKVKNYSIGVPIGDKEFWPDIFNKPFIHRGTIKNKHKVQ